MRVFAPRLFSPRLVSNSPRQNWSSRPRFLTRAAVPTHDLLLVAGDAHGSGARCGPGAAAAVEALNQRPIIRARHVLLVHDYRYDGDPDGRGLDVQNRA